MGPFKHLKHPRRLVVAESAETRAQVLTSRGNCYHSLYRWTMLSERLCRYYDSEAAQYCTKWRIDGQRDVRKQV